MKRINGLKLLGAVWALSFTLAGTQALAADTASRTGAPEAEICKGCHAASFENYAASIHGAKGNLKSPSNAGGCAACHGDGTAHVKAGGGKGVGGIKNPGSKSMPAAEKSGICLTCHEGNRNLAFWDSGKHRKGEVSCNNCHSVHVSAKGDNSRMLKASNPSISPYVTTVRQLQHETCVTCHKEMRAQINKPSHHPLVEGKVKCSDCHNPHGSLSPSMIKAESTNGLCLTCHADKRGPWIHEHPPVEENCLTCHTPHGSNHNRLLTLKSPELCQECHRTGAAGVTGHTGTLIDGRSLSNAHTNTSITARFVASGCVNCHRQIHGSNAARSGWGNAFVR